MTERAHIVTLLLSSSLSALPQRLAFAPKCRTASAMQPFPLPMNSKISNLCPSPVPDRAVPSGSQFKGYPSCHAHADGRRVWQALRRSPVARDLVASVGSGVRLAIRVKVFPYPDGCVATWAMLAAIVAR